MPYVKQSGQQIDFTKILATLIPVNAEAGLGLAKMLVTQAPGMASIEQIAQLFVQSNKIQETTAFLLEALKGNKPEEAHLQTKLLEINLQTAPNVAEAIFQMKTFTHYDRNRVALLCEQAGLYARAVEHFTNTQDIKRALLNTHAISKDQMVEVFKRLDPDDALASFYDLMKSNRQNCQIVAEVAIANFGRVGADKVVEMFESVGAADGMFFYLGHVLPQCDDHDLYLKYITAAARLNKVEEIEKVIRNSTNYDPEKVKNFLMDAKLPDPRPLIYLCDTHGYQDELTRYLYKNKQNRFIEIYLFKVNNDAAPKVLGTLVDLDCDETYIKQLLNSIRVCPIDELVEEF